MGDRRPTDGSAGGSDGDEPADSRPLSPANDPDADSPATTRLPDGGRPALAADRGIGLLARLTLLAPTVVLARRNLSRTGTRTILAVAAVAVGVVAVGGVGLGGEAFTQSQTQAFAGFGGTADVEPADLFDDIDRTELDRIEQAAPGARTVPIQEAGQAIARSEGESRPVNSVLRISRLSLFYEDEFQSGGVPNDWGATETDLIVGATVAEDLGVTAGDRVTLTLSGDERKSYRVVGVLEPQGVFAPLSPDGAVFLPIDDDAPFDRVTVQATQASGSIEEIADTLRTQFNGRERTYSITENEATLEQVQTILRLASAFVTSVGAVSLLVAVVTVANTMLMSVIEREGEIGVLRAVGYTKFAIVRLMLAEATMIGLLGAAVGVPIALGMGLVANELLLGDPLAFTAAGVAYVVAGVIAGVAASVIAGIYPAWKAANKRPVEALE